MSMFESLINRAESQSSPRRKRRRGRQRRTRKAFGRPTVEVALTRSPTQRCRGSAYLKDQSRSTARRGPTDRPAVDERQRRHLPRRLFGVSRPRGRTTLTLPSAGRLREREFDRSPPVYVESVARRRAHVATPAEPSRAQRRPRLRLSSSARANRRRVLTSVWANWGNAAPEVSRKRQQQVDGTRSLDYSSLPQRRCSPALLSRPKMPRRAVPSLATRRVSDRRHAACPVDDFARSGCRATAHVSRAHRST